MKTRRARKQRNTRKAKLRGGNPDPIFLINMRIVGQFEVDEVQSIVAPHSNENEVYFFNNDAKNIMTASAITDNIHYVKRELEDEEVADIVRFLVKKIEKGGRKRVFVLLSNDLMQKILFYLPKSDKLIDHAVVPLSINTFRQAGKDWKTIVAGDLAAMKMPAPLHMEEPFDGDTESIDELNHYLRQYQPKHELSGRVVVVNDARYRIPDVLVPFELQVVETIGDGTCLLNAFLLATSNYVRRMQFPDRQQIGSDFRKFLDLPKDGYLTGEDLKTTVLQRYPKINVFMISRVFMEGTETFAYMLHETCRECPYVILYSNMTVADRKQGNMHGGNHFQAVGRDGHFLFDHRTIDQMKDAVERSGQYVLDDIS
jgi:hypothetical protein